MVMGAPIGTFIGGELGEQRSRGDRDRAEKYIRDQREYFDDIAVPTVAQQELAYDQYGNPLLEDLVSQADTELGSISLDPSTRNAQMSALARLQGIADEGGMDALDRARMNDVLGQAARQARGQREAVRTNMAQRGMAGSGMELVQQMMANQGAADQANREGLNVAAMAQQRALDAIMNSGQLGGQIRGQDYGQARDRASAQDAINRFNAGNAQAMQQRNIDRKNQTNMANTDLSNAQQQHNKGLYQQQFQNQMGKASGQADASGNMAGYYQGQADRAQGKYTGYGRAYDQSVKDDTDTAVKAAPAIASMMSDRRAKKNIDDVTKEDLVEFFSAVDPKLYEYKEQTELTRPGKRIGFMLQDVQDTKLGRLITKKTPEGELYMDTDNLNGILIAALAMGVS